MKIIFYIFVVLFLLQSNALADFGFGQSASFNVNLLTFYGASNHGSANSNSFSVNLLSIRRAYADSDSSSFDWLANTAPQPGTIGMCTPVPSGSFEELYCGAWVDAFTIPPSDSNVIIVNHGWNGSVADMLSLAQAIHARVPQAYIYAWNWGKSPDNVVSLANPNGQPTEVDFEPLVLCATLSTPLCVAGASDTAIEVGLTLMHAHSQGSLLGDKLLAMGIRPDTHHIQMIGHSFGGVVSADAAETLYKKTNNTPITQLTTIDTPALFFPYAIDAVDPASAERVEVIYYDWLMDFNFARAAMGKSWGGAGGPRITTAINVLNLALNADLWSDGLLYFRAVDWYVNSAASTALDCESEPYGFGWSMALCGSNPGWDAGLPKAWRMETQPWGCSIDIVATAKAAVDRTVDKAKDDLTSAASWVGDQANIVWDGTKSALLLFVPTQVSSMAPGKSGRYAPMDEESTGNAAFVRKDVNVPPDAEQMVFDYRFGSVTPGDRIEVAVNGQTMLVIDGEVAGVSQTYTMSSPIAVSQYVGQSISLQIALYPGGTEAAQVYINNLRFVAITLAEDIDGDKTIDYPDLSILAQNWLTVGCNFRNNCDGADINGDNKVDFADFARLAAYWLESF